MAVRCLFGWWTKQKQLRKSEAVFYVVQRLYKTLVPRSDCTLDLVGTEASGTNMHMTRSTVNNSLNALDVGLHRTIGTSMGVGNIVAERHTLAADIALCHLLHLLAVEDFGFTP